MAVCKKSNVENVTGKEMMCDVHYVQRYYSDTLDMRIYHL